MDTVYTRPAVLNPAEMKLGQKTLYLKILPGQSVLLLKYTSCVISLLRYGKNCFNSHNFDKMADMKVNEGQMQII